MPDWLLGTPARITISPMAALERYGPVDRFNPFTDLKEEGTLHFIDIEAWLGHA
jgi:hypothetical protein